MSAVSCRGCQDAEPFPIAFTMAFQPIVDVSAGEIWGYEALVRGAEGQGAGTVLAVVTEANRYVFDQACRVKAIELAGQHLPASSTARLSINFMPNAVYEPRACIRATLAAAARTEFNPHRLMFEFTENERMADASHVANIVAEYKRMGFLTALDDFGAGYAGLGLLAKFQPDLIKIDMELLRGIDTSSARQHIIGAIVTMAQQLGVMVLAEGVETEGELNALRQAGISLFQGYYFARPQIEQFQAIGDIRLAA
ncbi:EAL domain-containing protein [Devosia sp. WQ 349]|uniref:EAL domain-containing protein n=1 Tax=Devosia sp. WQ 349K1 TaxID=2800329 RepID=UPI001903A9BC|nr:EAL domain-containing protein [Devosia sp. WQ 349K1]MBK1793674.1 EAL domain-containing protein [Devosia sp. WQ 349K1]